MQMIPVSLSERCHFVWIHGLYCPVTTLPQLSDFCFQGLRDSEGFPGISVVKTPPANAGHMGSIPGSGRSPEKEMVAHSSTRA